MNPYEKEKYKLITMINKYSETKRFKYKVSKDEKFNDMIIPNYGEEIIVLKAISERVKEGEMHLKFQEGEYYIEYKIIN